MSEGAAKYGRNNWRRISYEDNINHAITHLMALLIDDDQDDHLEHALTRLAFAVAVKDSSYRFTEEDEVDQNVYLEGAEGKS